MCGIAGFFGTRDIAPATVERMQAALRRRGPDAEHAVCWDAALARTDGAAPNALLHTRLSIIDPRPVADQPMGNDAGDVWIAYNGEVYDWADAARELEAAGYVFRTRSDTEFILHAYEHWGIGCVERLRGMFAIALLDLRQRALFLIRDRLGLKPIVYAARDEGLAFGSTVRSLLPWLPPAARRPSAEGIDAYLAHRTIPAPRTIIDGVQRLPPAHYLRYDLGARSSTLHEYWRPVPSAEPWLATFDAAILMRTVADRPLGLFLSSGIDSSAIACRLAAMGCNRLQSFTAAFPGTAFDESALAGAAAARLGFPHLDVPIPQRIEADFAAIVADLDEPFADPSSVPTWYLARETTRHVKVVLGGDGGDEMFGGYKRYAKHLRTRWRRGLVLPSLPPPAGIGGGWQRLREELRLDWRSAYVLRFSGLTPGERAWLAPEASPQPHYWRMPAPGGGADLAALLEIDRLNYLPDYILRKADLMTMAHGLEMRAPFLDHRFVGALAGLPPAQRFTRPAKQLLAPAMAALGELDPFAQKKRGFNPPIAGWLEGDLAPRLPGLGQRLHGSTGGLLDAGRVDGFVAAWRARPGLGEQLLQLLILDESLAQLAALARSP
ncbi:MAG: asparagine synthase (glutamine-hydrolyzing) [Betaproteobacteria bacterium]|nr:asparagine synthase (glutamine-hydrolyzing) [Betaproteobacteria bacterium]MBK8690564.1 asparagine synthase (glutamine-hydrolyzing) [Betaproteobacteria bacterium]MBL0289464.1 asparagine synthase (glutamine-hydrolyzing) [Betaproteobacteria bacterium]